MIATALLALVPQAASHDALHPAGADVYLEVPDLAAFVQASSAAPMARLCADDEALRALRDLFQRPGLTGAELVEAGLALMFENAPTCADLRKVHGVSLSWRAPVDGTPARSLLVVDLADEATAAAVAEKRETLSVLSDLVGPGVPGRQEGARVVYLGGGTTAEVWDDLRSGRAPNLGGASSLDPARGPVVVRGFVRRNPASVYEDLHSTSLGPAAELWTLALGEGPVHFRMTLDGGRFVTESHSPGTEHVIAAAPWLAPRPFDPGLLAEVHPGCLLVAGASFDRAGLRDALGRMLAADLSGQRLFDRLGSSAVLFAQPVRGLGLPKTYVVIDLAEGAEPDAVLADLAALAASPAVAGGVGSALEVQLRTYKDVPYATVTLPPELSSLGDLGTLRPVIAVFDGKLFVTNGTLTLKSEIRRRLGDADDQLGPADYPWTRGEDVFGPGAAAALYVDWGAQVEGLFALGRTFGGMLSGMVDLPYDLTNLPDPRLFTRHMPPTIHTVRRGNGVAHRHEAGFAFETWIGLAGGFAMVMDELDPATGAPPTTVALAPRDPREATQDALSDLRTALTVYKIDQGAFPTTLDRLVEPTESFPRGYLDGKTTPEPDAWGHPFRYELTEGGAAYRLWSTGADGVDQDGAGDDVSAL
jgi:hypothetical protein